MNSNVMFLMLIVGTFAVCFGYMFHALMTMYFQHQKTSWLVLRLLADYGRDMSSKEITESLLVGSMGLVTLPKTTIRTILDTQQKLGLIKVTSAPDGWASAHFSLTPKGEDHLSKVTKIVQSKYEEKML